MRMYDIIDKKRKMNALTEEEICFFVSEYIKGNIPDYQASALLMAVCLNGMTNQETAILTKAMAESGDMLDITDFGNDTVDKHSTGGVGDKTTLIVAPIVASLGCKVIKLSGRGLGHTGGTLDKLESIDGMRIDYTPDEFKTIAKKCNLTVCGAGANIAPADKKLYALRDVTATVQSIPLIVSSIMSKKLAGGAKNIVLDVKTGSGAFMKTLDDSRALAKGMVEIGKLSGKNVSSVITNMDKPLGYCIGNSLEVAEAVSLLKNEKCDPSLLEVCLTLATEMVALSKNTDTESARKMCEETLKNGNALNTFTEWITLQNGNAALIDDLNSFADAKYKTELVAECGGYITSIDASGVGIAAMMLGAGRSTKDDVIDHTAGIIQILRVGDKVEKGSVIAKLQSSTVWDFADAKNKLTSSITISKEKPTQQPLIYEIIR